MFFGEQMLDSILFTYMFSCHFGFPKLQMNSCPLIHDCGLVLQGIISTHSIVNYSIFSAINLSNIYV